MNGTELDDDFTESMMNWPSLKIECLLLSFYIITHYFSYLIL